ncbi:MAG TPA: RNB domain-containing ribonuclease [Terriglobales bacterium]|nr:RNB domain-containing ribonuclease [Terriglobales bacterium]
MVSDSAILKKIERQPRHTAGYKQLVRELGVRGNDRRELAERLRQLVARGELVETDGDRYAIPQTAKSKNAVTGRLTMHRDGYGFVIPESAEVQQRIKGDIYIHANAIGSAMHGDRVLVEMGTIRSDGRSEGRILRVLGRAHPTVVGTFHYGPRYNYVRPMDEKITLDVIIPRGMEVPETGSSSAVPAAHTRAGRPRDSRQDAGATSRHRVIGEEVKHRAVAWEDLEGVVVDAEITEWPTPTQNPRGRVIEILGYEDDFGVDVEIVIRKYHLPHRFPGEVLEEAQAVEDIISARELQHRREYRSLPIVTIDGETARDFDDAVLVRRLENGNFELQVHIADVAHYVNEDSALDREARLRGNSVYFPDRAVPMLPIELSTNICSLRPHVDRLVMSCTMEIDHQGEIRGYEVNPGVIRSAERMTYTDVNFILEGDPGVRKRYERLAGNFELMRDLAMILNRKRERRGSIDFDLPEPVIEFDAFGLMRSITRSERNIAHRLIEEFMLSANECVAHYLEHKAIPSLYRIHEKPDPKRVYEFESIAAAFGYSLGVGALPVQRFQFKTDRRASYGTGKRPRETELPKEVHITPRMYQKLTQKIAGKPEEQILSYLMLRSLKQARYSEENEGHFALATATYTHFTSPIRRYPDLIIHRILKDALHQSAEAHEHGVAVGKGVPLASEAAASPWSERQEVFSSPKAKPGFVARAPLRQAQGRLSPARTSSKVTEPIPLEVLHEIAEESSQAERRADDAERELMEWKKVKFMEDRVGEDFDGLIVSVTKFGLFVELTELFVEGLVPLSTLTDDRYTYHENTRQIIGQRSRRTFSLGDQVRVLVDRIDPVQKKIQFALFAERPARSERKHKRR